MKSMQEIANESVQQINEAQMYDDIIAKLQEAKENKVPLDEGLITGIIGGIAGATFGPKVMTAVCNALGIDVKGPLGNLMTSRLILTAVGTKVGW